MNEWGVTIASDACLSREKKGELTDGGIGYWLRRAMAERAKTAREAVQIGGALINQYGYTSSGRTYCIAGQEECWMLAVVNGKHWVAQRVPADHVAIIPNYYTITTIDLSDSLNFYGSADLIEYAKKKKWYNPDKDGEFNFREVYSDPKNLENMGNIVRYWSAINKLSAEKYDIEAKFPFSFKPKNKIPITVLFDILRNHNEGTEYDESEGYTLGNPHEFGRTICSNTTQYGFVAQIRNDLPKEIGAVMWLSPFRPCVNPFTQWYVGITEIPENFNVGEFRTALIGHFEPIENIRKFAPDHHFPEYVKYAQSVDKTYGRQIKVIHQNLIEFEQELIDNQASFEKRLAEIQSVDPRQSNKMMTDYTEKQLERSLEMMQK
jgi:dipeptidase